MSSLTYRATPQGWHDSSDTHTTRVDSALGEARTRINRHRRDLAPKNAELCVYYHRGYGRDVRCEVFATESEVR